MTESHGYRLNSSKQTIMQSRRISVSSLFVIDSSDAGSKTFACCCCAITRTLHNPKPLIQSRNNSVGVIGGGIREPSREESTLGDISKLGNIQVGDTSWFGNLANGSYR